MFRVRSPFPIERVSIQPSSLPNCNLAHSLFKRNLFHAAHMVGPISLAFAFLSAANVAQAQGTIDFSGATTLMTTFRTFAIYAGAVICFGGLIFAGIRMLGGRFQEAIPGLFGALFGAGVLGWGAGWIGSLTGQSM
jgi:uncharacterized protein YjbI with pentapeptide repeats